MRQKPLLDTNIHIKYVFFLQNHSKTFVSVVDDKFNYAEGEVKTNKNWNKSLNNIFDLKYIDNKTEIIYDENIDNSSELFKNFKIFRDFLKFKFTKIPLKRIVTRICRINKSYLKTKLKSKIFKPSRIYFRVLRDGDCPWITENIETEIHNKSTRYANISRTLRIALYYMQVRRYLANKYSNNKKDLQNSKSQ